MNVVWVEPAAEPAERADAARNRIRLLATAREMLAGQDPERLTMDALAQRAGLGKGTVFRRFGSRAGIFQALLDDDERTFQRQVLSGPPPLGPGAAPLDRLIAYGRARAVFMISRRDIARAAVDCSQPVPAGPRTPMSLTHIRMLLGQLDLGPADPDLLAVQLAAALDGPVLLYLSSDEFTDPAGQLGTRIGQAWQDLVERVCRLPG